MRANARPVRSGVAMRSGVAQGSTRASGARRDASAALGSTSVGWSHDDRDARYVTVGSHALAPSYAPEFDEPVRNRTAAQREAADQRAAERAAERAVGEQPGTSVQARRRLRVAPPLPVSVARAPFVAMLLGIVVAGVVGILVLNTMINANQFRLNNLQSQQVGLDQREQQLRQNLAQEESPGSLLVAAKNLGLVPAGTLAYIQIPNGTIVGVPEPSRQTTSVTDQIGVNPTAPTPTAAASTAPTPTVPGSTAPGSTAPASTAPTPTAPSPGGTNSTGSTGSTGR